MGPGLKKKIASLILDYLRGGWESVCVCFLERMCICVYAASRDKVRQRDCFMGSSCAYPTSLILLFHEQTGEKC